VTKEERIERGIRSARLLADDDFKSVFTHLQMQAFIDFEDHADESKVMLLKHRSDAVRSVKNTLQSWALDAKLLQENK
jgi:hypothetical protein